MTELEIINKMKQAIHSTAIHAIIISIGCHYTQGQCIFLNNSQKV